MPLITLITDRKADDFFLGRLKGQLYSACKQLNIVDLAHNIKHHSISAAAFVIKNSYLSFPEHSIHLIGVDSESSATRSHLIAKLYNQYFITADNGLLSLAFDAENIQELIKVDLSEKKIIAEPALFTFGKIACDMINGKSIQEFGQSTREMKRILAVNPTYDENYILGNLIYTDSYENAVTNITYELFNNIAKGRKFIIYAGSHSYKINKISYSYQDVDVGNFVAVFNSMGLLEIAMNKGEISRLLSFNPNTKIRIEFK